jgi:hypothetical protein
MKSSRTKTVSTAGIALILVSLSIIFPACTLPPISVFVGKAPLSLSGNSFPYVQADDMYFLVAAYTDKSLTDRLRDSSVKRVDLHLANGESVTSDSVTLRDSSLIYWVRENESVVSVDSVQKILIYGSIPWNRATEYVPAQSLVWALLGAVPSLAKDERINFTSVAIAASIGASVGVLLTINDRPKETILFRDFKVIQG